MEPEIAGDEFSPQYPVPLVDQITEFLTNAIIEGRLQGGQRLIESELQRKFGISRTPIRESFRILENNGLVINTPRRGTFVRKMTKQYIEENFPIRAALEGLAARLAVPNMGPENIEKMELALSNMTEAAEKNDFKSYLLRHHSDYHMTFIHACKNETLIKIVTNLRRHYVWFRYSYLWHQENFKNAIRVHQQILDLFIKKDADRVEQYVKEHIVRNLDRYLQFLEMKGEEESEGNAVPSLETETPLEADRVRLRTR